MDCKIIDSLSLTLCDRAHALQYSLQQLAEPAGGPIDPQSVVGGPGSRRYRGGFLIEKTRNCLICVEFFLHGYRSRSPRGWQRAGGRADFRWRPRGGSSPPGGKG